MSLLNETPDAPPATRPYEQWSLNRWIVYRDQQLEARAYALKHGDPVDIISACIRLAEHHIELRKVHAPSGPMQVIADVRDLA